MRQSLFGVNKVKEDKVFFVVENVFFRKWKVGSDKTDVNIRRYKLLLLFTDFLWSFSRLNIPFKLVYINSTLSLTLS